jgi:hypothetical protein
MAKKKGGVKAGTTIKIIIGNSASGPYLYYEVGGQVFTGDVFLHPGEEITYVCDHAFVLSITGFTPMFESGHGVDNPGGTPQSPFDGFIFASDPFASDPRNRKGLRVRGGGGGSGPRPLKGSYKYALVVTPTGAPSVPDDPQIIIQ